MISERGRLFSVFLALLATNALFGFALSEILKRTAASEVNAR